MEMRGIALTTWLKWFQNINIVCLLMQWHEKNKYICDTQDLRKERTVRRGRIYDSTYQIRSVAYGFTPSALTLSYCLTRSAILSLRKVSSLKTVTLLPLPVLSVSLIVVFTVGYCGNWLWSSWYYHGDWLWRLLRTWFHLKCVLWTAFVYVLFWIIPIKIHTHKQAKKQKK